MASNGNGGKANGNGGGKGTAAPKASDPVPQKAKRALNADTRMLPVAFRVSQIAFLDSACAVTGFNRAKFVREAVMAAAAQVNKQAAPKVEDFRAGRRGELSHLSDEQREAVATAERCAAAEARRTARQSILAKLAATGKGKAA